MKKIGIIAAILGMVAGAASIASAGYFNPEPIEICEVRITRNLQRGSENNDVLRLQNMLARGGYLYATPNGYFGYQTEAAVRAFQRDNGIYATGQVGEATRNAVNERMCDTDVVGYTDYSYGHTSYGYSGTTYVTGEDPYVQVINAPITPLPTVFPITPVSSPISAPTTLSPTSVIPATSIASLALPITSTTLSPVAETQGVDSANIIYNPSSGYGYGITPASGSVTVTSPLANASYNEGDTVSLSWFTNNLTQAPFSILLENTVSGQSKMIGTTGAKSYSFTLTKELLDAVCAGSCNYGNQNSYRIVVSLPVKDIAGNVSTLKAAVQPVVIKRQFLYSGQVSITTSKSPVNSGETFRLYVNIPRGASWDSYLAGNYSIKVKATCPSGVTATVAGATCGQEFTIPFAPIFYQQEIPAMITNSTWFKQNVQFDLTVINLAGQVIGTSQVNVVSNGTPFSW